jgi:MFS family permease
MRDWARRNMGGLPGTFWVLWTGILVNKAGGFAVLFLTLYLTGPRGLTAGAAGLLVGGYGIGAACGTLLGGVLADRWGRRSTLLVAHFGAATLLATLSVITPVPLVAAIVALVGLFQGAPGPAFVAAITDLVPEHDRPRAFNLQFWAFNTGVAVASLLAGLLAQQSFTVLFLVDASATLVTAVLITLRVPETVPHRARTAPATGVSALAVAEPVEYVGAPVEAAAKAGIRVALADRIFMVFVGLTLLQAVVSAQSSTILPLSMKADGLRPSSYGLLLSLTCLLVVAGQLFVPAMIRRFANGPVLAASLALYAVGYGALAFAGSLAGYLAAAVVWTIGVMLAAPPNATIISQLAPQAIRARYQAVFYLTFSLASFVAPALGGFGFEHLASGYWLVCGAVGGLAALGHLLASRPRERRVATATAPARSPEPASVADATC